MRCGRAVSRAVCCAASALSRATLLVRVHCPDPPSMPRGPMLRRWLIAFASLLIVACDLLLVADVWHEREVALDQTAHNMERLSLAAKEYASRSFAEIDHTLTSLAETLAARTSDTGYGHMGPRRSGAHPLATAPVGGARQCSRHHGDQRGGHPHHRLAGRRSRRHRPVRPRLLHRPTAGDGKRDIFRRAGGQPDRRPPIYRREPPHQSSRRELRRRRGRDHRPGTASRILCLPGRGP
jgi:hypothetical protein